MAVAANNNQEREQNVVKRPSRKVTEYGRQLMEKQKVKKIYGMRERQFKRFFMIAAKSQEATGALLLSLLERRLDNVVYRLKFTSTRTQSRQIIVHGHIFVNGTKVHSPSFFVSVGDVITLSPTSAKREGLLSQVVDKRLNSGVRSPEWIECDKKNRQGTILRLPVREDIQTPIEEQLIVELYSK